MAKKDTTSWESVEGWYKQTVGKQGHYYHQEVVLPSLLRLLKQHAPGCGSLIDLACGQGVLARALPKEIEYLGVDLSPSLITFAKRHDTNKRHRYITEDIANPAWNLEKKAFDCATIVLALQNVENPAQVIANAASALKQGGKLFIVLNHPCFRIPRQSFWGVDEQKRCRYRRLEVYLSPMKIPIQAHPSMGKDSPQTWSFHHPLSSYFQWLAQAGFAVDTLEEWCSPKQSTGRNAKMENRSRQEFPLFLTLIASL